MDCRSSRSGLGLRCDNPFTAPAINNMLKQEHPFPNLESDSLVGDSPFLTQKVSAMPPLFPAMVGEGTCLSSGSKAPRMGGINNQCLVYGEDSPSSWKGSQETAGTPRISSVLSSKKGQERSTACNAALKVNNRLVVILHGLLARLVSGMCDAGPFRSPTDNPNHSK